MSREYPQLWFDDNDDDGRKRRASFSMTRDDLLKKYSSVPEQKSLVVLCRNTIVVGQEFALACWLVGTTSPILRNHGERRLYSAVAIWISLLAAIVYNESQQERATSVLWSRLLNSLRLAVVLRVLMEVMMRAIQSGWCVVSEDALHALAMWGMILHLVRCNYSHANGVSSSEERGKISRKSAAFFSTVILASSLSPSTNITSVMNELVLTSVLSFRLYPAARHDMAAYNADAAFRGKRLSPLASFSPESLNIRSQSCYYLCPVPSHLRESRLSNKKCRLYGAPHYVLSLRTPMEVSPTKAQDTNQWSLGHCAH